MGRQEPIHPHRFRRRPTHVADVRRATLDPVGVEVEVVAGVEESAGILRGNKGVEHADGSPFSQDEKDRLVLIDNSPEGISGSFDFSEMVDGFSLDLLRDCGMDLSKIEMPEQDRIGFEGRAEKELEQSDIGEESETLKDLHRKRADSKKKYEDMLDFGFYAVLVFQDNAQRKAFGQWCADHGVPSKYEGLYVNGEAFAEKSGIEVPECKGSAIRERLPNAVLESMTLDGSGARPSSHRETANPDAGA